MSASRSLERLKQKLRPRVIIEFRRRGDACPACGFVFDNGFSRLGAPGQSGFGSADETLTLCTRCRKLLAVPYNEHKPLRLVTEVETMLLSDADRAVIAELSELYDHYTARWD